MACCGAVAGCVVWLLCLAVIEAAGSHLPQVEVPTSAELRRGVEPRFSQPLPTGDELETTPPLPSAGPDAAPSPTTWFDVGKPLSPEDFFAAPAWAPPPPQGAGQLDPVELAGRFEGDITLTPIDADALRRGAVPAGRVWPGAVVRYVLASGFSRRERAEIAAAVDELERLTCVQVRPLAPGPPAGDYVHIVRADGCYSGVGRLGGNQTLSLGDGCLFRGVVLHQLLHAAGLWHEQSRPDRDLHVQVHVEHVAPAQRMHLRTYARQPPPPPAPYDVGSLLHLGRRAFSADRRSVTISARQPDADAQLGQRRGMSRLDALAVSQLYDCGRVSRPPQATLSLAAAGRCRDHNHRCHWWAGRGECARNSGYMDKACRKSCLLCDGGGCSDLHRACSRWAALGQCELRASYMHVYCRRVCGLCDVGQQSLDSCDNKSTLCRHWKNAGECLRNPEFMAAHCQLACKLCQP